MQSRAKNYLIILLAFATLTAGAIAWQQTKRLKALQAELIAANTAKPAHKAAAAKPAPASDFKKVAEAKPADDSADPAEAADSPRQRQRNNRPNIATLMADPKFAQAWNTEQKSRIDNRYAALFAKLNLPADQLDKLKSLLVERESSFMDVMSAARDQGLDPRTDREAIQKLVASTQSDIDNNIKTALGDTAYQQYQNYQATQSERAVVSQLSQTLSYSATPLTPAQSDFLVQALSQQQSTSTGAADNGGGPGGGGPGGWGRGGNSPQITDAVIQQAQSVLTPDQVTALKNLQAQQQAQKTISEAFRAARTKN